MITAPATVGYAYGSPRVTETGVSAGKALHLDEPVATGNNMAADSASDERDNWLSCVSPRDKPIGLAEYGPNCNGS